MSYVLQRSDEEHERLRRQALMWEPATERLLDRIGLGPGATCLDAGCGPGETMRLMAERVGPAGQVTGFDVDAEIGARAVERLHAAGHRQTAFEVVDVQDAAVARRSFDLVFARLLLLHVDDKVGVLRRLWDWVAPGGHLVIQEHDMVGPGAVPPLESTEEFNRVVLGTFAAAGRDNLELGRRLPLLHAEAGIGPPDGTDVIGRLERIRVDAEMYAALFRSVLPAAISLGIATAEAGERWFAQFERDAARHGDRFWMWPLMIGTWKRR